MKSTLFVATLSLICLSFSAKAQPQKIQPLHVDCTTAGTSPDGSGKNCSDRGCYSAPDDHVIVRDFYVVTERANNGGWYGVEFSEPVEVVAGTGITAPRKVCISVGANSKGGMFSAGSRGWEDVVGEGQISKYK